MLICVDQEIIIKVKRALSRKRYTRFDIYKQFEEYAIERGAQKAATSLTKLTPEDVNANAWRYCAKLSVELVRQGALPLLLAFRLTW